VPVDRWFAGDLRGVAERSLLGTDSRIRQYLDGNVVRCLMEEHLRGTRAHGHRLWTLMNLELWCRMLEDGRLARPMAEDVESGWTMVPNAS
jgi:asparagine synthase (glutamine-hydrolysing)